MDGKRIQDYFANETKALINIYKQFQILIPDQTQNAAAHKGEDGRYVESLIKEFLTRYLPQGLKVFTGFILRPAVKTGQNNKRRKNESDAHSNQLDIIVYDHLHYPIFQQFSDNVIVPPEGVIGIISVKKKFNDPDFKNEAVALKRAAKLCRYTDELGNKIRGPYLAMVAMNSVDKPHDSIQKWVFNKLNEAYVPSEDTFDETVGLIANISNWSIFKRRPNGGNKAEYIYFKHDKGEEHLGFQFLLTGLLSVYYDKSRNFRERPGFSAFPSGRGQNENLGAIDVCSIR